MAAGWLPHHFSAGENFASFIFEKCCFIRAVFALLQKVVRTFVLSCELLLKYQEFEITTGHSERRLWPVATKPHLFGAW